MARPLAGVRVLESTTMITGPLAGMMLADLGADVIKVENPDGGDPFRSFRGGKYSPYFFAYNRNKRSIALDIRSEEGKTHFKKLVAQCDVLIENSRPGVFARLGLGVDELRRINPKIILCSISGFGPSGPYKDRPAYDAVAQALAGVSSLCFYGEPQITGPTIADSVTGIFAAYGILGALYERAMTGVARTLDVNMLDSTVAFMPDTFLTTTMLNIEPGPLMRVQASQSYAMTCSDGKMIAVHMSSQEKFWKSCTEAFNCAHLMSDPRFDTRAQRIQDPTTKKYFTYVGGGLHGRARLVRRSRACGHGHERHDHEDVTPDMVHRSLQGERGVWFRELVTRNKEARSWEAVRQGSARSGPSRYLSRRCEPGTVWSSFSSWRPPRAPRRRRSPSMSSTRPPGRR